MDPNEPWAEGQSDAPPKRNVTDYSLPVEPSVPPPAADEWKPPPLDDGWTPPAPDKPPKDLTDPLQAPASAPPPRSWAWELGVCLAGALLGLGIGGFWLPQTDWHRDWMGSQWAARLQETEKARDQAKKDLREAMNNLAKGGSGGTSPADSGALEQARREIADVRENLQQAKVARMQEEDRRHELEKQLKELKAAAPVGSDLKDAVGLVRISNPVVSSLPIKYQMSYLDLNGKWSDPKSVEMEGFGGLPRTHEGKGAIQWKITFDLAQQGKQPPHTTSILLASHLLPADEAKKLEPVKIAAQYAFEMDIKAMQLKLVAMPPQ